MKGPAWQFATGSQKARVNYRGNRAPGTVTVAERFHRWNTIAGILLSAAILLFFLGLGLGLNWPPGQHIAGAAAIMAGIAVLAGGCIWGCARSWRMGAEFDENGVTVRHFFSIQRFGWAEVRRFRDGVFSQTSEGGTRNFWALAIQLADGREVIVKGTARKKGPRPHTLEAIMQAADQHAIPVALTGIAMRGESPVSPGLYPDPGGKPGLRHWDGEEWSPLLQPDLASGGTEIRQKAPEVYSPLPGTEHQWHDAAARARRASIWLTVWLVATPGALVWLWAGIDHADSNVVGMAATAVLITLGSAGTCWQSRRKFRKIARTANTATENSPLHQ